MNPCQVWMEIIDCSCLIGCLANGRPESTWLSPFLLGEIGENATPTKIHTHTTHTHTQHTHERKLIRTCRIRLVSEQSKWDTIRGDRIKNRGYFFLSVYMYVWTYVCHFNTHVRKMVDPIPYPTKIFLLAICTYHIIQYLTLWIRLRLGMCM